MLVKEFIERYYVDRKSTHSVKWDGLSETYTKSDLLPLWVADMDFKVPEKVQEKLAERVNHGVFGYSLVEDEYYEAFINWQKKRHNIDLKQEWVRFTTGVVNSFNYLIQSFTQPEESVLILAPVYYPFFDAVKNNNRQLVVSNLVNTDGYYTVDLEDFEKKIVENQVKVFLHCSPHNPVGRVWSQEELLALFTICQKHQVKIISDEIHQDFIQPGRSFLSALSISEEFLEDLFVLSAPSKTFNLASLLHSHVIIPNENHRQTFDDYLDKGIGSSVSVMGMIATEAAYTYGEDWVDDLINVIEHNFETMKSILEKELPHVIITNKEATYLAWIDLSYYLEKEELVDMMENKVGIAIDYGEWFDTHSATCIRINLATKTENIEVAMNKLVKVLKNK
ncbi:MAG: MalY/PatB family protein [Vagococcus sp.]